MMDDAATETMIELEGLAKRFDMQVVVEDVTLAIRKGEFIALMGPSGCGKTTTLRMIAGLERPSAGDIRMWGRSLVDVPPWARDTPLVWQSYALFPFLSVRRNVEFGLKQAGLRKTARRAKAEEWMRRMGISDLADRDPGRLSGGQRQRVALARALATEPEVLLLDEPLSALDPHLKVKMQTELVRLHRELGITFICVTHSHSEAFAMADRVVIMDSGRVQQVGSPREIYRRAKNRFVASFIGGINILSGTIASSADSKVTIATVLGPILAGAPDDSRVGNDAHGFTLAIPADRVKLLSKRSGVLNEVPARIATLNFVGSTVTVFLTTESGIELQADLHIRDLDAMPLAVDDQVVAQWSPHDGYFIEA
jgi:spermidine/putrescine transport system ATP-binding protein